MKRLVRFGVIVCALALPLAAQAQEIHPVGWTAEGNVVIYIGDPLGGGEAFEWAKSEDGTASEAFYAVCTPMSIGAPLWNQGCTVCSYVPDEAHPGECGLDGAKWAKLKAAKKSPNKKVAVSTKRACTGKGDDKECKTTVAVGKVGNVIINDTYASHKAAVTAYFRKDSGAVLLISAEQSPSDEAIYARNFLLIDLTAPGADQAKGGGGSAFLKKWEKMTDKVCACKTLKCLDGLQAELQALAATAEQDAAGISQEDAAKLGTIVERMTTCATKIAQTGK